LGDDATTRRWTTWIGDHRVVITAAVVAAIYLATFARIDTDGFWINDNSLKFLQVASFAERGVLDNSLPHVAGELDPDRALVPMEPPFVFVVDEGRLRPVYPVAFAALNVLPYRVLGKPGLYLLLHLGAAVTLLGVFSLAGLLAPTRRRVAAPLAVLLVALASPVWFYSFAFWEHGPAAAAVTWAIVAWVRHRQAPRSALAAAAGACAAAAVWFRLDCYAFLAVMAVASIAARDRRHVLHFIAGAAAVLAPLWLWNYVADGFPITDTQRPVNLGFGGMAGRVEELGDRALAFANLFMNAATGPLSYFVGIPSVLLMLIRPRLPKRWYRRALLATSAYATLLAIMLARAFLTSDAPIHLLMGTNSLFAGCPLLVVGFLRCDDEDAGEAVRREVGLLLVAYLLLFALVVKRKNTAGLHWGCRFLLPAVPGLLCLAAVNLARGLSDFRGRIEGQALLLAAPVAALLLQIYGLHLLSQRLAFSAGVNRTLASFPGEVVVSDSWRAAQEVWPSYLDRPILLTRDAPATLYGRLRASGVRRIVVVGDLEASAAWDAALTDEGLHFSAVGFREVDL
jgi:hypothetical protein